LKEFISGIESSRPGQYDLKLSNALTDLLTF